MPYLSPMHLACPSCTIRPWQLSDKESLLRHANNRAIWLQLRDRFPHPYTPADAEAWLQFANSQQPQLNFAIAVDNEAVGGIGLLLQEDVERVSAEIGYWLGEAYWGRGIMSDALRAFSYWAFATYPLRRLYALPFATNAASVRVLQKAGYSQEGYLRRSALKNGQLLDQYLMALTDLELKTP